METIGEGRSSDVSDYATGRTSFVLMFDHNTTNASSIVVDEGRHLIVGAGMKADFPRGRVRAVEIACAGGTSGVVPNAQSTVVGCRGSGAVVIDRAQWEQEIQSIPSEAQQGKKKDEWTSKNMEGEM